MFFSLDSPEPVAHAEHGYRYTALITFSDGRLEEVPAGYTTFHPARRSAPVNQMLFTNVTFSREGCFGGIDGLGACSPLWSRDEDAEVHTARIDLENGGVVHAGDILKGTVNFYTNTSGIRTVQAYIETSRNYKWGQSRAQDGGSDAFSPGSCFDGSHVSNELSTSSYRYGYLFGEEDWCKNMGGGYVHKPAAPSVDFQIQIADDAAQNFQMHYADVQSFLEIAIDFPYPSDIQKCLNPSGMVMQAPVSETDLLEDRMWEAWRPLDDESISDDVRTYRFSARIPVTILGARKYALNSAMDPPVHYLDPEGVASPVLLIEAPPSIQDVVFPTAQPVISVKPKEDVLKQMMASYRHFQIERESSLDYSAGEYAGVLWKKKYVAGIKTNHPVVEGSGEAKSLKKVKSTLADNMRYIPRVQVPVAVNPL
ncbi:hypothetical protein FIBSPDRAFT_874438 [Athelia psychrophila]|uniref:Uncharacterized protein n=1 Tax=Athelia psychrophila TaxID=1759441 RepID=A0A165XGC2_9AGAM|nr:hypothetical protein FIBSPDRAFT_874438 [Fibularhizoctonia sp. CBS 109695]